MNPFEHIHLNRVCDPFFLMAISMCLTQGLQAFQTDCSIVINGILIEKMDSPATYVFHEANSRGSADYGWLKTFHSFSFSNWNDPERMHFGALRVLNDDVVSGGHGFLEHPHENMEIISIPLKGSLKHSDNTGRDAVISKGEVQIMSAGSGIMHSEKNNSALDPVNFLQIWLYPNERNLVPTYAQASFDSADEHNELHCIVSPSGTEGVKIHQNAWLHIGEWDQGHAQTYRPKSKGQGVYVFVLEGSFDLDGHSLSKRDAIGVTNTDGLSLKATTNARILLMDVPMKW